MPEVHVIFPPQGPPLVSHETQACVAGRFVTWHIRSDNPKITHVLLEFEDPRDEFFSGSPRILVEMNPCTEAEPHRSHQMVWGEAPDLDDEEEVRRSKYTVYGQSSESKKESGASLDPMILITRDT